ncbi:DinB family protein [Amycolatopsis regifaucium]|uniref:Mini-circle protein n=1 Tax=Amycolatopsis regifaucium TaxID=546365 RepID=A0A154MQL2_9PSEU|nr:DinB family protein [Amycolatopsis regifaucium]KZB86602.1 Mini-circle protein [Amycolatopsis regifaucium]OKA03549.1 Mini-circle protein [Amycolatopsis regifaucium]
MTWTAPEVTRPSGDTSAAEHILLPSLLAWHRSTFLQKVAGLTGEQLATASVPPSNLTLLGLIRHLAKVERIWFRLRYAAQDIEPLYDPALGKDHDFEVLDATKAEAAYNTLLEEIRLADEAAAHGSLDDTFDLGGNPFSLRMIYVHMIGEYARHNGHADLLRERVDSHTGA